MGRKLKSKPKVVDPVRDVVRVEAEGVKADMEREQYDRFSEGRTSMSVPDLPFLPKRKSNIMHPKEEDQCN